MTNALIHCKSTPDARRSHNLTKAQGEHLLAMCAQGKTHIEIAAYFGVSENAVYRRIKRARKSRRTTPHSLKKIKKRTDMGKVQALSNKLLSMKI